MRLSKLKITGMVALSCLTVQVQADGDAEYPAAYFEPVITYQDPALISSTAEPDESAVPQETEPESEVVANDSVPASDNQYPAAYFEPVIVFQDSDYIAAEKSASDSKPKPTANRSASSGSKKSNTRDWPDSAGSRVTASDSSSFPFMGLLIVLGLFGYVYWMVSRDGQIQNQENVADPENNENGAVVEKDASDGAASTESGGVMSNEA